MGNTAFKEITKKKISFFIREGPFVSAFQFHLTNRNFFREYWAKPPNSVQVMDWSRRWLVFRYFIPDLSKGLQNSLSSLHPTHTPIYTHVDTQTQTQPLQAIHALMLWRENSPLWLFSLSFLTENKCLFKNIFLDFRKLCKARDQERNGVAMFPLAKSRIGVLFLVCYF